MTLTRYKRATKNNCLATRYPELAKQWHSIKNGGLTTDQVTYSSHRMVWWQCPTKKHEWQATVNHRTNAGRGCPYCRGYKVAIDNCLGTMNPQISKEWHPSKNKKITPYNVTDGNDIKVWWLCPHGHSYLATIKNRTKNKTKCPYCTGKLVTKENNLLLKNPKLCLEWDYSKNKITPYDIHKFSSKKVYWLCRRGHSYLASVAHRSGGKGCPYCSGNKVSSDNCLKNTFPELCNEWNYTKNGKITPQNVSFGSNKKVWWKCIKKHEWSAKVLSRTTGGTNCPYCNKVILKDGAVCDSLPEAVKYIEFKNAGFVFKHNKKYNGVFGNYRYDFYFPDQNKYVEVTSYNKKNFKKHPERYFNYLRNIVKKRKFVKTVFGSEFEFVQFTPTKEQIKIVRENMK